MIYRLELASDAFPSFNYSLETFTFFFPTSAHHQDLNTAAELTQQKFIYSLCCDFQAAERDS